jgi:tetratricopeptide (TPR) repeat protein
MTRTGTVISTMNKPYPGTRPFREVDRDRFFGRAGQAAVLADLWQTNQLTIVDGPVASGKTSLLKAGVLPLVRGGRAEILLPGRVTYGSTFPFAALPEHNPYSLALLRSWDPGQEGSRLVGLTVGEFVQRRAELHSGSILAVIDQAEEVLADSGSRWSFRQRFLSELAEAIRTEPRLHLLLILRTDANSKFANMEGGARFHLTPLTAAGAFQAVTAPLAETGREYDAEGGETVVKAVQASQITGPGGPERYAVDDYVQPSLLQVVCTKLWDALPSGLTTITARDVRRYAQADAVLAAHCGQVIAGIADDHDMPAARLRSWMLRTFVMQHGTRGTAYEGPADTAGMPNAVVRALEDRHLLSAQWRSGSRWYELLSDRLIEPLRQAPDDQLLPTGAAQYLCAAERALSRGELDLAERYTKAALRATPETDLRLCANADSLLGNLAFERGKPAQAEASYKEAALLFEAAGDTAAVARELAAAGQMLLAQGQPSDALEELRAAVDRQPHDPVMQTGLGQALWQLGQNRAALAVLNSVLEVDGSNPEALRARGEILADLGSESEARSALRDLDRVNLRDRPAARAARALALARLGEHSAASQEIEAALAQAPRNGPVLLYAALATALGGDTSTAERLAMRAADASDPSLPPQQRDLPLQLLSRNPAEHR